MSKPIHQEVVFTATPKQVYEALTDARQFSQFTGGAPAEIGREVGGGISLFGGKIVGRNVELVPGRRVVQAWRAMNWEEGVYSIVRFELKAQGAETRLIFDQDGFPDGEREHLDGGWHKMYWEPMKQLLG
jgi:activator of HSP90 ATPase